MARFKSKLNKIYQRNESKTYLVKKDEIKFFFIMISFIFTFGLLFYYRTWVFFSYVSLKYILLYVLRSKRFYKIGKQFFLLDYCYTVFVLMLLCTRIAPRWNFYLLTTFYINAFGPLLITFLVLRI
jgi:hypothetical protein